MVSTKKINQLLYRSRGKVGVNFKGDPGRGRSGMALIMKGVAVPSTWALQ